VTPSHGLDRLGDLGHKVTRDTSRRFGRESLALGWGGLTVRTAARRSGSSSGNAGGRTPCWSGTNPRDQFDLDRDVERELRHSYRAACVPAGVAEQLDEEV
jgi:hypothetical protein